MSAFAMWGALEIGLIYGLVALGVLISFRILDFPDLTVDGSFPLGGGTAAVLIQHGVMDPFTATLCGTVAAGLAGMVTGWLNIRFKIQDLLASILMMIALYSINLRVMMAPNVPLIREPTVFKILQPSFLPDYIAKPLILLVAVAIIALALVWFFSTKMGLAMRSTGSNARMARAQGVHTNWMVLLGMGISNALCGLAGALFAQGQGGADVNMGIGTIVIGLAAVIIGESIMPSRRMLVITFAVIVGAVLYRFFIALALNADFIGLKAQDLKFVTALLVTLALVLPLIKQRIAKKRKRA